jgi:hypothetical protein
MPSADRAQLLSQLGNVPGQYQQSIAQAMQQRLLASQLGTAQSKADTLATIQKEMADPAAFQAKYGFSPAGMDATTAQEIVQRSTLARVEAAAKPPTYIERDIGNAIQRVRSDTGEVVSTTPKGMAPGTKESNDLARQRLEMERGGGGDLKQDENGFYYRVARDGSATPVMLQNGQPMRGAPASSAKPTEDQAKAGGWLMQATGAYQNMIDALKADPNAADPGLIASALGAIAGPTAANVARSPTQQQYLQGASSFSEAVLRAATGAGVNNEEAAQKIRELTPQVGDSDAVKEQKSRSMLMYLEALRLRAGPAAVGGAPAVAAPNVPAPTGAPAPAASAGGNIFDKYNLLPK